MKRKKTIKKKSFYFQDYNESEIFDNSFNINIKKISLNRVTFLSFVFFSLILIFSIKIIYLSLFNQENYFPKKNNKYFINERRDIVDRNGIIISRNVNTFHAAIDPKLIKDKKNFLLKLRLNFPNLPIQKVEKQINEKKYFRIKKRINQIEKEKFWALGEKGIKFEPFQARMYTHGNLFSHIIGQVDYDNYGISGIEKSFDKDLKDENLAGTSLELTLDTNIQHLISKELNDALLTFKSVGGAALLINVENGEILSLVSLPNFDINKRTDLKDNKYTNKITKGVYELGSIFKTFTIALALETELVKPQTIIKDIPRSIKCSKFKISDIKEFPRNLSVEDILIRSSNVGTLLIARKIGEEKFKKFIKDANLLKSPEIQIEEVGKPIKFNWNKCKLETVSFGHGITTTPLQAVSVYASLVNGGTIVKPSLIKKPHKKKYERWHVRYYLFITNWISYCWIT